MFWITFLVMAFSWMLTKLGFLSATVGILSFAVKLLLIAIFVGTVAAVFCSTAKKNQSDINKDS
jgi:uncharacterized membrane protein